MLDLAQNSPPKVKIPTLAIIVDNKIGPLPTKTHPFSILQVPTTQLAKMSIGLKFVELTADVLEIFFIKHTRDLVSQHRSHTRGIRHSRNPIPKSHHSFTILGKAA